VRCEQWTRAEFVTGRSISFGGMGRGVTTGGKRGDERGNGTGHPRQGHRKSEITKIKILRLDDFSYCDATNTCCMDLIFRNLFFVNTSLYVFKCQ